MAEPSLLAVAHRAGNDLADLRAALDADVDLVEADVHWYRRVLEVRHRKAIGRHLLWERWLELTPRRGAVPPMLAEVLRAAGGDGRLMLDLKGPTLAVAAQVAAVLRELAPGVPVTVCTKRWRMLDAFHADRHVRCVLSASNRAQLGRLPDGLRRRRAYGVSIRRQLLTPASVARLREQVDVVMVWPVDTEAELEHALWLGATGVISKNLPLLRRLTANR